MITLDKLIMVVTNLDPSLSEVRFEVQGENDEVVIKTGLKSSVNDVGELISIQKPEEVKEEVKEEDKEEDEKA